MGQRSQIYVRYNINYTRGSATSNPTTENYRGLIARYYQWNYGERMISRARSIIEAIKSEFMEYGFMWGQNCYLEKLNRICDVNFDMRDIVMSTDIIKEVTEEWDCDCGYIFNQDNNDGQLLIDVTENGIKYCFIPFYNEVEIMNGRQYLIWDSQDSYDVYQWTETEAPKEIDEETKKYTLDNLDYITEKEMNFTMANICSFSMKVKGTKENIEKFIDMMKQKGTVWMGRGASVDFADIEELENGKYGYQIDGDTKWSVQSSMISNAISMRTEPEKWCFNKDTEVILSGGKICLR